MNFTKEDWKIGELHLEPERLFILWAIDTSFCRTVEDFRHHFGDELRIEEVVRDLKRDDFLAERDEGFCLTDLGHNAVAVLQRHATSVSERCALEQPAPDPVIEANEFGDPLSGPPIALENGRHVIVYWLEEDENGMPKLPAIDGDPRHARSLLQSAFFAWKGKLRIDVAAAAEPENANLIITGKDLRTYGDGDVVALMDMGSPYGRKLRIIFDLSKEDLTKSQFQAVVAHWLGHILGIRRQDVEETGDLISPATTEATEHDVSGAGMQEWRRT
jgi:hypothetical protein